MKVALIFDVKIRYPPDYNNMKCYYVTRELCSRGIKVGPTEKYAFST